MRVNWTDDSRLSWAFAEVAKLEDVGQAERPPYLAFLNALFVEIGPDAIEGLKKETLKQEIRERWPDPIVATFNLRGQLNNFPRLPYQFGAFATQAVAYLVDHLGASRARLSHD